MFDRAQLAGEVPLAEYIAAVLRDPLALAQGQREPHQVVKRFLAGEIDAAQAIRSLSRPGPAGGRAAAYPIAKMTSQPSSTKNRFLLLSATYITGVIVLELISMVQVHNFPNSRDDFMMSLIVFMLSIVFLPAGLFQALAVFLYRTLGIYVDLIVTDLEHGSPLGSVFAGLSYLIFLGIVRAALLTNNQRTFRILYFIFIGLLAIDIGGCTVI